MPEDCYISIQAKEFETQEESKDFSTEYYYGTQFKIQKFEPEFLQMLKDADIKEGEVLDNPVDNVFVPDGKLITKKAERKDPEKPGHPEQLKNSTIKSEVWFKQDDTFD